MQDRPDQDHGFVEQRVEPGSAQRLAAEMRHGLLLERALLIHHMGARQLRRARLHAGLQSFVRLGQRFLRVPLRRYIGEKADHPSDLALPVEEEIAFRPDAAVVLILVPRTEFEVKRIARGRDALHLQIEAFQIERMDQLAQRLQPAAHLRGGVPEQPQEVARVGDLARL